MRAVPYAAASPAPEVSAKRFVVVQVRQALQQTAAIGACSPYFAAACATLLVQICLTIRL